MFFDKLTYKICLFCPQLKNKNHEIHIDNAMYSCYYFDRIQPAKEY